MKTKVYRPEDPVALWKAHLKGHVPNSALGYVARCMSLHSIFLNITKPRKSKYGDYRPATRNTEHKISVNGDLSPERFLWTLVHELAHLFAHINYGPKIKSHGEEWKYCFHKLMQPLLRKEVFPVQILPVLRKHLTSAKATGCTDMELNRAFLSIEGIDVKLLSDIPHGVIFQLENGKRFVKGDKQRTRFMCKEIGSSKRYLVHEAAEVELLDA
jgi:SprT protein